MTDYLTIRSNTRINAVTQYQDFDFNSMTVFNDQIIGANDSGIFTHTGDKDNGANIEAYAKPILTDFGSEFQKRIRAAYIGYQADGQIKLTVEDDEGNSRSYQLHAIDKSSQHGNKLPVGRDGKGRYWQFKVENVNGSDFTVDNLSVEAIILSTKKPSGNQLVWENAIRAELPAITCSATAS